MIRVRKIDDNTFEVSLDGPPPTKHRVRLSEDDYQRLTQGKVGRELLITRSFEFLLERESNTSILRSFDLPVIAHYFPEYEREIKDRLK